MGYILRLSTRSWIDRGWQEEEKEEEEEGKRCLQPYPARGIASEKSQLGQTGLRLPNILAWHPRSRALCPVTCWLHCSDGEDGDTEAPPSLYTTPMARPSNSRKSPFCCAACLRQTKRLEQRSLEQSTELPGFSAQQAMDETGLRQAGERAGGISREHWPAFKMDIIAWASQTSST